MATWIMGGRVNGRIPLSTCTFNINFFYIITRVKVNSLKRPISTYTIVTTMINSMIVKGGLGGIKIPISTSYITLRYFKTVIIRNKILIIMLGERVFGLLIPLSNTSIAAHLEITCLAVVACTLTDSPLIRSVLFSWCYRCCHGMNCIIPEGSITLNSRAQGCRKMDCVRGEGHSGVGEEVYMN